MEQMAICLPPSLVPINTGFGGNTCAARSQGLKGISRAGRCNEHRAHALYCLSIGIVLYRPSGITVRAVQNLSLQNDLARYCSQHGGEPASDAMYLDTLHDVAQAELLQVMHPSHTSQKKLSSLLLSPSTFAGPCRNFSII
jgi:hypothetical protein